MSDKVAELSKVTRADDLASMVVTLWETYNNQRKTKVEEWKELRNYIFATDTTTTTNATLPWKNSTTLPKLCQIRDNLHANYISSLFPNDNWLQWSGYTLEDSLKEKAAAIQSYMGNKTRVSNFRHVISRALLDYIDYGNAFAFPTFVNKVKIMPDGEEVPDYIGPVANRISPLDIVFNPTGDSLKGTYKVVRSRKSLGEVQKMAKENPEDQFWAKALESRQRFVEGSSGYSIEDFDKADGYHVDGFGNLYEYYGSGMMEILEFYGDYVDPKTRELKLDQVITVVDRRDAVRATTTPYWYMGNHISHAGWRERSDNLWAMGPLDNLVGLQYRLDHLENLKADAMDLAVHPPLKVIGEVEEFVWGPGVEISIDEGGSDVQEMGLGMNGVFSAASEMQSIEDRMELYAGAPREAMGVRTPGEKTAFEVEQLQTAAGRIFQEKVTNFEITFLEPLLNNMLEITQRNMSGFDTIRVMDNDLGVEVFTQVTPEDITANGKIRPVGARHFSQVSQDIRNLADLFSTPLGELLAPHTSALELTKYVENTMGLSGYKIFSPNIAIQEQQETEIVAGNAQEEVEMQLTQPVEATAAPGAEGLEGEQR